MALGQWPEWVRAHLSRERWEHTLRVVAMAESLATRHCPQLSLERVKGAALFHDCAKDLPLADLLKMVRDFGIVITSSDLLCPQVLHGPVGAAWVEREWHIKDRGLLQAISMHTTGGPKMEILAKIIFVADYIEIGRNFPGAEKLREIAFGDLSQGVLACMDNTLCYLVARGEFVHPRMVAGRNYLLGSPGALF